MDIRIKSDDVISIIDYLRRERDDAYKRGNDEARAKGAGYQVALNKLYELIGTNDTDYHLNKCLEESFNYFKDQPRRKHIDLWDNLKIELCDIQPLYNLLEYDKGILVGSRSWGVNTTDSDYDVVVSCKVFNDFISKYESNVLDFGGSGYNWEISRARYDALFQMNGYKINLIAYDTQKALDTISVIDRIMDSLPKKLMEDREYRYHNYTKMIHKFITFEVLGIPEINLDEDEIPFR